MKPQLPENVAQRRGYNGVGKPGVLSDGNDPPPLRYGVASSSGFDERRLGLVGDHPTQILRIELNPAFRCKDFGCQCTSNSCKIADLFYVMSSLGLRSNLRKTTLLVSFALISLAGQARLNAQCSIDNLSFTPNANHDGIVVHGVATGCNSVTVRFTNPQLADKSQAVTPGSPFAVEFGPADGVTATMLQNNFVCGSRNFKGIIFCTDNPNCGHTLDGEFDCSSFCPPSISLSVHTVNGDLVDPTPCLPAGTYSVRVNEQVPVSSSPDWDWFINNVYQTSVVNPSDGFSVSITSGQTTTVSLNGRVGQCHLNAAIVLQGCSQPPNGGGSPSPTAAQPPTATQAPPGAQTPTPTTPPVENQAGLDWCYVWMILNVILIIITLILIVVAFCAPHPATISLAVAAGIVTLASLVLWLILCSNWILIDQHFCDLLKLFMVILGWIVAVVAVALVAALIALAAGQVESACAIFGLLADLGFLGTILAICTLVNFYFFHCPLT